MTKGSFSSREVESAFEQLGAAARAAGKVIDLAVYGGTALVLTFPARVATKDVDAVARSETGFVRQAARQIALARGWPEDWLNDAVKGFLSHRDDAPEASRLFRTYPSEAEPGLRVFLAAPHYLLAMKCLAMRLDDPESRDVEDIKLLVAHLGITSAKEVLEVVERFYPPGRIPPKTRFGVEEIMEKLAP
jgi:hypothetical protein